MTGMEVAMVAGLGACGALVRWGLILAVSEHARGWAVVGANTLGSVLAGFGITGVFGPWGVVLAVGLFGAITTLSTLAVDSVEAWTRSKLSGVWLLAGHIAGGLGGVALGVVVGAVFA